MAHDDAHAHANHSAKPYIFTVIALYVFTILTFTLAQHDFGEWNFFIAMAIALTKGMLVVLFFMHLWWGEGINRIVFLTSFLFLAVLMFFVMADVGTRFTLSNSRIPPLPKIDQTLMPTGMPPGMGQVPQGHSDAPGRTAGKAGEQ